MLISLANLPTIGSAVDCGIFAGVVSYQGGMPCAVLLLPHETPDPDSRRMSWYEATEWAKKHGYTLPSPVIAVLLATNLAHLFKDDFYWTSEALHENPVYAWQQSFAGKFGGSLSATPKRHLGRARAVQLVPLSA